MDRLISLHQAIDVVGAMQTYKMFAGDDMLLIDQAGTQTELMMLPSIQPETNCSEFPNNSDTISRQQAINVFETAAKGGASIEDIKLILAEMPSAQPDIIRCKDCINYIDDRCTVADHHVAPFSCCGEVFGAKNRGEQE